MGHSASSWEGLLGPPWLLSDSGRDPSSRSDGDAAILEREGGYPDLDPLANLNTKLGDID